jgi:hypothetical protein
MTPSIELIRESLKQLPTTSLSFGEFKEGKPAIFAGDEPIFLTRNAGVGQAYAEMIVAVFPLLPQLLQATNESPAVFAAQACEPTVMESGLEAQVRSQIESIVTLQPGMKDKAALFSKLVFSAVAPFLSGAPVAQSPDQAEASPTPSGQQVREIRAGAVSDFIDWLTESGEVPGQCDFDLDAAFAKWVGESNV